jgi:hypothetical protein
MTAQKIRPQIALTYCNAKKTIGQRISATNSTSRHNQIHLHCWLDHIANCPYENILPLAMARIPPCGTGGNNNQDRNVRVAIGQARTCTRQAQHYGKNASPDLEKNQQDMFDEKGEKLCSASHEPRCTVLQR